jgi:hypothetical protein
MKILKFIFVFFAIQIANGQTFYSWKVKNYNNNILYDSFTYSYFKNDDTIVQFVPGVIYMCKFKNKFLIVDYEEKSVILMPMMVMQISANEKSDLQGYIEGIESEFQIQQNKDSTYIIYKKDEQIKVKYNKNGNIEFIEVLEINQKSFNGVEGDSIIEINKTIYERSQSENQYNEISIFNYLNFKGLSVKLTKNYNNWEFQNLFLDE